RMNIHRERFVARVTRGWELPRYVFWRQRRLCLECDHLRIEIVRQGREKHESRVWVCATEQHRNGYRTGEPMACLDARTSGACGADGALFIERRAAA
ncbi:MAG: hypothetical protein ABI433_17730, partial [Burkholderiaceae bacterium]